MAKDGRHAQSQLAKGRLHRGQASERLGSVLGPNRTNGEPSLLEDFLADRTEHLSVDQVANDTHLRFLKEE